MLSSNEITNKIKDIQAKLKSLNDLSRYREYVLRILDLEVDADQDHYYRFLWTLDLAIIELEMARRDDQGGK